MLTLATLTAFLVPALIIILVLKLIALPFKIIFKVLINVILGGIILFGLGAVGIITVSLTWWMAAIVGILGIPGAIIVAILSIIL